MIALFVVVFRWPSDPGGLSGLLQSSAELGAAAGALRPIAGRYMTLPRVMALLKHLGRRRHTVHPGSVSR